MNAHDMNADAAATAEHRASIERGVRMVGYEVVGWTDKNYIIVSQRGFAERHLSSSIEARYMCGGSIGFAFVAYDAIDHGTITR